MDLAAPSTPAALAPDIQITGAIAHQMHWGAVASGDLWIWAVTTGVRDYPGFYCARPASVIRRKAILPFVLLAASLDAVRDLLPCGLDRLARNEADDPVVIETWL